MNGSSFTLDKLTQLNCEKSPYKLRPYNFCFSFLSPNTNITRHNKQIVFILLSKSKWFFLLLSAFWCGFFLSNFYVGCIWCLVHVYPYPNGLKWKKKLWAHLDDFIDIFDKQFWFVYYKSHSTVSNRSSFSSYAAYEVGSLLWFFSTYYI